MNLHDSDMSYYDDPVTTMNFESPVVLEIKTETFVPTWALDLVRSFGLVQSGFSKYCYAIDCSLESGGSGRQSAW